MIRSTVRRAAAVVVLAGAASATVAGYATASEGPVPPHGHLLVLGVEFTETGPTYRKCIEVAAGRTLPVHAHHENFHAGTAGDHLRDKAGNFPVPTAPLTPWSTCAEFAAAIGAGE